MGVVMRPLYSLVLYLARLIGVTALGIILALGYKHFPNEAQFESAKGVSAVSSELEELLKIEVITAPQHDEIAWHSIMLLLQKQQWKSALTALEPYVNKMEEPSLYWADYAINYGSSSVTGRISNIGLSKYDLLEMSAANGNPYAQLRMSHLCRELEQAHSFEVIDDKSNNCKSDWLNLARATLEKRQLAGDLQAEYRLWKLDKNIVTKSDYLKSFEFAVNAAKNNYYVPILERLYDLTSPNGPFWDKRTSFNYSEEEKELLKRVLLWLLDHDVAVSEFLLSKLKVVFNRDEYLDYLRRWLLMAPDGFEHTLRTFYTDADLPLAIEGLAYAKALDGYAYSGYSFQDDNAEPEALVISYINLASVGAYRSTGEYSNVEFNDEDIRKADILAEKLKPQVKPTIYLH